MQKVLKRTVLAERQAARRLTRRKEKNFREQWKSNREQVNHIRRDEMAGLKQARLNRREDYELGPLAPKRDVGDAVETWGTINQQRARGQELEPRKLKEALRFWGGKHLNLTVKDRVVLLEGHDKGKIGVVKSIDKVRAEVTVEGLNKVDVSIPKYMIQEGDTDKRPFRTVEKPVPINSLRLVYPLTDVETGVTRDVIVKKVESSKIWKNRITNRAEWTRWIPGLDIQIEWPEGTRRPEKEDTPGDTLRIDVETKTFVPTLLTPPMPISVIDELRNKYSAFRTRHDPEYIAAKEEEDRLKEEKKNLVLHMQTPLMELNRSKREARNLEPEPELTPEMLEKIGRLIAQKRQLTAEAVGVSIEAEAPEPATEPETVTA